MSGYFADRMAARKAESMLAPLLADDESSASGASDDGSDARSRIETQERTPTQKLRSFAVYLGLGAGVAASGAAMALAVTVSLAPAIAIFIMGAVCIANVPYAAFKERSIGKLPTFRAISNKMRKEVNNLQDQADLLAEEIDILKPEADRGAAVEEELREIAKKQRADVVELVELVKENEIILAKKRENLRQRIVQDMIHLVVRSDINNSGNISANEAKTLAVRISITLHEYDVEFDSEKFLKTIGSDSTLEGIIAIVTKLLPTHSKGGNRESKREKRAGRKTDGDEDGDDESDGNGSDSSEFWHDNSDYDSEDDDFDMFHIIEGPTGRSAGARVSLVNVDRRKARASVARITLREMKMIRTRRSKMSAESRMKLADSIRHEGDVYPETLQEELSEIHEAFSSVATEEAVLGYERLRDSIYERGIAEAALGSPEKCPDFELEDQNGEKVNLQTLLRKGPVVLVFYRGKWCPLCNATLMRLQREGLPLIKERGGTLVAISPMLPEHTRTIVNKRNLQFAVCSDVGNTLARQFNITFEIGPEFRDMFLGYGQDIPTHNGDETWEIPVPATYVISQGGRIEWSFVNDDPRIRCEIGDMVAAIPSGVERNGGRTKEGGNDTVATTRNVRHKRGMLKNIPRSVNFEKRKAVKKKFGFGKKKLNGGKFLKKYIT